VDLRCLIENPRKKMPELRRQTLRQALNGALIGNGDDLCMDTLRAFLRYSVFNAYGARHTVELRQLRYFVKIAELGSLGLAALELAAFIWQNWATCRWQRRVRNTACARR